jgi:hypothetical protein
MQTWVGSAVERPEGERSDMERLTWIAVFAATLAELRPYIGVRTLHAIGEQCYSASDEDPESAARVYHQTKLTPTPKAP